MVCRAVRDIRAAPPPPPDEPPADSALVAPCQAVDGLAVGTYAISGLMLEVAPLPP
ncbi:hypothetical protein ACFQ2K_02710 [Streptomyces sanglieri]|uniref:Uncharacterized protein n=1 Tax=Streptomyces sanglieri TaxID=193460 RepID=A0ABW2WK19_9ACTN